MQKIVVSNLCGIGDLIRTEPIIRALRKRYPDAFIAALVRDGQQDIFAHHPAVDDIFVFPVERFNRALSEGADGVEIMRDVLYAFIESLRHMAFDLVVAPPIFSDAFINGFLEARRYLGSYRRSFNDECIDGEGARRFHDYIAQPGHIRPRPHFVDAIIDVVADLNIAVPATERAPRMYYGAFHRKEAATFCARAGLGVKRFAVAHVATQGLSRRWYVDRWSAFLDGFIERHRLPVVIGCARQDYDEQVAPIIGRMQSKCHVHVVMQSLLTYAAIIDRAVLYVGTDSAPMHIADCFRVPCVVLFGGSDHEEARPYQAPQELVVARSMDAIAVSDVTDAVGRLMGKVKGSHLKV